MIGRLNCECRRPASNLRQARACPLSRAKTILQQRTLQRKPSWFNREESSYSNAPTIECIEQDEAHKTSWSSTASTPISTRLHLILTVSIYGPGHESKINLVQLFFTLNKFTAQVISHPPGITTVDGPRRIDGRTNICFCENHIEQKLFHVSESKFLKTLSYVNTNKIYTGWPRSH